VNVFVPPLLSQTKPLTHFIVPDFADDSVDLTEIKEVQKTQRKSKGTIKLEQ
jgi:hypothetical protein